MDKHFDSSNLGWFLPLRIASFVIVFGVVVLWMGYPSTLQLPFAIYCCLTLAFSVLLLADKRGRFSALTSSLVGLQFIAEVILESGILASSGKVDSAFSGLYLLTIVSAALAYRLVGTLILASLVSMAYTVIAWLGMSGAGDQPVASDFWTTLFDASDRFFYSVFLHILMFYLVAFISGYLAEHLQDRDRRLADTSNALRKAKLETDDILRHLNSGLLTIDSAGRITYFNRAAERILGYREEEVRGMPCEQVFAQRMAGLSASLVAGLERHQAFPREEIEIRDGDWKVIPLGLSTSILTEEDGAMRGVIAIFSDLTEAKRLEAKVRAADRLAAIGELSASIAHEIRNPLAAISGSVEVLSQAIKVDGEDGRLMELIVKESNRLNKILSDFLAYARIDRPAYNKVELCHTVTDVIKLLQNHPSFHDRIELRLESDESIVYVIGDEDLLKQLLINLAVNACEAIGDGEGRVVFDIVVDDQTDQVELSVSDNGPGISPEDLKSIYQPFFSTKKQGTGLGLSIVHRIASALKIEIAADSRLGQGTTFLLLLRTYKADSAIVRANQTRPASADDHREEIAEPVVPASH